MKYIKTHEDYTIKNNNLRKVKITELKEAICFFIQKTKFDNFYYQIYNQIGHVSIDLDTRKASFSFITLYYFNDNPDIFKIYLFPHESKTNILYLIEMVDFFIDFFTKYSVSTWLSEEQTLHQFNLNLNDIDKMVEDIKDPETIEFFKSKITARKYNL